MVTPIPPTAQHIRPAFDMARGRWTRAAQDVFIAAGLDGALDAKHTQRLLAALDATGNQSIEQKTSFLQGIFDDAKAYLDYNKQYPAKWAASAREAAPDNLLPAWRNAVPQWIATARHAVGMDEAFMVASAKTYADSYFKHAVDGFTLPPEEFKDGVVQHWYSNMVAKLTPAQASSESNPLGRAVACELPTLLSEKGESQSLWSAFVASHPDVARIEQTVKHEAQANAARLKQEAEAAAAAAKKALEDLRTTPHPEMDAEKRAFRRQLGANLVLTTGAFVASGVLAQKGAKNIAEAQSTLLSEKSTPEDLQKAKKQLSFGKVESVASGALKYFGYYTVFDPVLGGHVAGAALSAWDTLYNAVKSVGQRAH